MIAREDTFYVGYIKRPHGQSGEVEMVLDVDNLSAYLKKKTFLLDINKQLVPFEASFIRSKGNDLIVKFLNVSSAAQSHLITGSSVYLPLSELPPLKGKKKFYFHEIIGFSVIDRQKGELGKVKEVMDHLKQPVMVIISGTHEILIPIIDEFLVEVNREKKEVWVEAPEGLLDIYLDNSSTE
ncbi:MAG: 16S rRNA processing protein RimM [Candidatus Competibacteraceae bacterium]|nr:16S rRNA processing protein RimM [Candidatus Competibacteraceae bacterium]